MWSTLLVSLLVVQGGSQFVNLVADQGLKGEAAMGAGPQNAGWSAGKAIDGNTNQGYLSNSCAITNVDSNQNTSIWWKVWLQRPFNVAYLEIYFRSDTFKRSTGFAIYTYDRQTFYPLRDPKHLVYHHDPLSGCPSPIQNVTVNNVTQGIVFINERPSGYKSKCLGDNTMYTGIELCEIKVMGCDEKRYSLGCKENCPDKCKHQRCDAFNGSCIHGCLNENALTSDCIACDDGGYISNKQCVPCQGHCKYESRCNKLTGRCDNGCKDRWTGDLCQDCFGRFYGENCSSLCGNCRNKDQCYKLNGTCPNGCEFHFEEPLCQECKDGYYGVDCKSICEHCNRTIPTCGQDGQCLHGCESDEWKGEKCNMRRQNGANEETTDTSSIIGGFLAAIIVIVLAGVAGLVLKHRLAPKREEIYEEVTSTVGSVEKSNENKANHKTGGSLKEPTEATIEDDGDYCNAVEFNTYIKTSELQKIILEKNTGENSIFLDEFKRLPAENRDKCTAGQKPENIARNRFKNLFPYDHSRIILELKWSDNDNNYINANYIKDYNGARSYIATQGPIDVTLADFWRMVVQENIVCVIMLTNIFENAKTKCFQYWPEIMKDLKFGPCRIKMLQETVYAFHTERTFTIKLINNDGITTNKRTITQFHYTAWPDHGTPEELELVQFHRAVTKKNQTGELMLIHCSAGVGRTGTFIGLDSLLKQGQNSGRINVFEFVEKMRGDRMNMVQTLDQYIFLHSVLLCGLQETNTVVLEEDIPSKFESFLDESPPLNLTELHREFTYLQTLKRLYVDEDKRDGKCPENISKNKDMNIIPVSKYRPFLTSYVKGRNDYINAVLVPMVSLIPQMDSTRCCGPYSLILEDAGSSMGGVSYCSLIMSTDEQRRETRVFSLPCENDSAFLNGVKLLLENGKQHFSTNVVMSKDCAGQSGVFCVVHNVLQQLRMDKEVDIFTAVRQIQTRRPEVITKLNDYRRCYELVLQSLSDDGTYANI